MMVRTQITLDSELQKLARQRASDSGVSLAEYVRSLVARDLERAERRADVTRIFDLGASGQSDIAREKHSLMGKAFAAARSRSRRSKAGRPR